MIPDGVGDDARDEDAGLGIEWGTGIRGGMLGRGGLGVEAAEGRGWW